ncbi:alcohol dehydrogenase [Thiohalorhabdus methylotrophus]|uniref:Alcohol dehydrogenase n=1 Tax=Thiohalorhabdus methylotrophus TaxID=3242694 RepID=A0ABV4TTQ9_9GAMM
MKVAQVREPGAAFEVVEREIPEPGAGQVRLKVEACGICHSDAFTKDGAFPGIDYPRVPGHEVTGRVDQVGSGVQSWSNGQRAAVGWHGGHCGQCDRCRAGDFITCRNAQISGISYDGGYAEYMIAPEEALVSMPQELDSVAAAPLLCAGITTYNALRHSGADAGDVVAVQGVGGLGHLGIQYARRMGYHTVALSNGTEKRDLALELGAHRYVDAKSEDVNAVLQELGGAKVILATAPSADAMTSVVDGLGVDGELIAVGATPEPIQVSPFQLIMARRTVSGWASGTPKQAEDTLAFSRLADIQARIETYPLDRVNEAYDRMINNEARFRVVLTM